MSLNCSKVTSSRQSDGHKLHGVMKSASRRNTVKGWTEGANSCQTLTYSTGNYHSKFSSGFAQPIGILQSGGQLPNQAGALHQPPQQPHGEHQPMLAPSQHLQQGIATMSRSEDLVHTCRS